ncbi:MAG: aminotransferase class III-fold pyridoxal phosphate-dependent enzyme [Bacteroidota bacterium]
MKLFDVYPLMDIELVDANDCYVIDSTGQEYLDLYGGHAVISVGHGHPHYVKKIQGQLNKIAFYSNSVINNLQTELADKLGELSGYKNYNLFLCNSGAEANENALKLASFTNKKSKVISFHKGFHGRTSRAVAATDSPKYHSPADTIHDVQFIELGDLNTVEHTLKKGNVSAVIIEGLQGLGGIYDPGSGFLLSLRELCNQYRALLILDEVQSGYGRTGKFFAHQYAAGLKPDIITVAKGMGNGFPIAGVLIAPEIPAWYGMLGTTFGGNHLACSAGIAVLDIIKEESLMENTAELGQYLISELQQLPEIKEVRGRGLMIGIELETAIAPMRKQLVKGHHILTGVAANPNVLRLLPPLTLKKEHADQFLTALKAVLANQTETNPA